MKRIIVSCLLVAALSIANFSYAQNTAKNAMTDPLRSQNWNPKKGQYYFSHMLTYTYHNVEDNNEGAIKFWLDPVTGTMLFQKGSSFQNSNFEFIIATPEGKYTYFETDDIGRKIATSEIVEDMNPDKQTVQEQQTEFKENCIPKEGSRVDFGWQSKQFELLYTEIDAKEQFWLTEVPFNVYPLYCFDLIEAEVSLPISFDYAHIFGKNQLITEIFGTEAKMKLSGVEANPISKDITTYREIK